MKKLIFFSLMAFMLCACGPIYRVDYEYVPPKNEQGKRCLNHCLTMRTHCQSRCDRNNQLCVSNALDAARPAYRAYVREQRRLRLSIDRSLEDFANTASCNHSCGCTEIYRECYKNCGGQVIPHKKCVAFCDKANK